jgi:predicted metal-dependent phosphoesterase TrpH
VKAIWRAKLWAPIALTLVIGLTGFAATSPLRGIGGGTPVPVTLRLSALYIALAPWCDFLDTLTLLSVRQHLAFASTLLAGYSLWRSVRWNRTRAVFHELVGIGIFAAVLVGTYSVGALLPRPMASLHVLNPDALAVDFHSHTRASWDGRRSFSSENNRSWHRDAGFDAVYISDHGTLSGVIEGEARNPKLSGDGTVILPAVEVRCDGHHVIILGATIQEGTPDCASAVVPASSSGAAAHAWNAAGMITLLTIPARFALDQPIPRSQAIEIADAAPRAFDQMERDGPMIRRIARNDDLAVVASSNNHGWGRTAAAWSILDIPHWRKLSPAQLDAAIRSRLAVIRGKSVYVVERRRVTPPSSALAFLGTAPSVAWQLLTILSPRERASWIVWIWVLWSLSLSVRHQIRIRRLPSSPLDAILR